MAAAMPDDDTLPLEGDLIKVLASDTRRDILRLLKDRRMTLTELATELELGKATISEHLNKLSNAGLVERQDEGRLWVYYDLSKRGRRILNPRRTRFILVVGLSVAATVLAVGLIMAFQPFGDVAQPPTSATEGSQLDVSLQQDALFAGSDPSLNAVVEGGDPSQIDAYLIVPEARDLLQFGVSGDAVPGYRLDVQATQASSPTMMMDEEAADAGAADAVASPDASASGEPADRTGEEKAAATSGFVQLRATDDLPPGTYYLYVRDRAGNDNRDRLVEVQVLPIEASVSPETWWRGLDDGMTISLTSGGRPVPGTLVIQRDEGSPDGPGLTVPLADGRAGIDARTVDALDAGVYRLELLADDGERTAIDAWFEVRDPGVVVSPGAAVAGRALGLDVRVLTGADDRSATVAVRSNGTTLTTFETGETDHLTLGPQPPGTIEVSVGRLAVHEIDVEPVMTALFEVRDGPEHKLRVLRPDGSPAGDVTVDVDGARAGTTNASGELALDAPTDGHHVLTVRAPDGTPLRGTILVEGWRIVAAPDPITFEFHAEPAPPSTARLAVTLSNAGSLGRTVNVVADVDGEPAAAATVVVPPGAEAATVLEPRGLVAGGHTVAVRTATLAQLEIDFANRSADAGSDAAAAPPSGSSSGAGATVEDGDGTARAGDSAEAALAPGVPIDVSAPEESVEQRKTSAEAALSAAMDRRADYEEGVAELRDLVESQEGGGAATPGAGLVLVVLGFAAVATLARRRFG